MKRLVKKHVLIVEDEQSIRNMLRYALEADGFSVSEAENVKKARLQINLLMPDLILLDWMLPDVSGVNFTRQIKADSKTQEIPIILLTARAQEENKIKGLDSGADDYVVKPFSPRELIARIHAVLRRGGSLLGDRGTISVGELSIDLKSHRTMFRDEEIKFGPLEFRLLCFFATHQDRVFSRNDLLSRVWGADVYLDERTVDVHIRRLRKRLSVCNYDHLIQTIHGSGYRFSEKVSK